ncbi:Multimerin-1 [Microtus ochrogaster]|uniref:Multimerin-1 n=1 Tax=Microtus ochrogaster TaxID=79684 RepID=A0A8J6GFI0_MICOH|nr:Multimerin-1 [Microtus ochrogaster]
MKGPKLFVLLSSLWGGVLGLTNTLRSSIAPEEENFPLPLNSTSAPQSEVLSLQVLSATQNPSSQADATPKRPSEDTLLLSTLQTSETSTSAEGRSQTPTPLEKTEAVMALLPLALQSKSGPGAGMVELANATLNFLQSFSR